MRGSHNISNAGWILALLCCACGNAPHHAQSEAVGRGVVSLVPAVTELLVSLGEGHRLTGRAVSDSQPSITNLPAVGDVLDPNVELISAINPALLVVWDDPTVRARVEPLRGRSVEIMPVDVQTLVDLQLVAERLGARLGFRQRVDSAFAAVRRAMEAATSRYQHRRLQIAFVVWLDPPVVAAPGSYPDELIGLAGGTNVFADARGAWPRTSVEAIVARAPDVVVTALAGVENTGGMLGHSTWSAVPAVAAGRVFSVDADLFTTPGLDVVGAVTQLRRLFAHAYADRTGYD